MIPLLLNEWSVDVLEHLLEKSVFEDDSFDFKEMLPDSRNEKEKDRLRKTCSAFANADGGFLVFGVTNNRNIPSRARIVGIDPNIDFPEHFGNFPKSCFPSVSWEFRNPPIVLENKRVIHVALIPKSWRAPHAVAETEGSWTFPKRTNKGNEPMSIEEIRSAHLGFYEKRLKLQLLHSELLVIDRNAQDLCMSNDQISTHHSLVSFDTAIMDSVIADTYSITSAYSNFHNAISQLRQKIRIANNKINLFFSVVMTPLTNKEALVREHNTFMVSQATEIRLLAQTSLNELDKLLHQ